ncbi:MAG: histidine--tRNA ligase [Chitinophagales bacterium]
MKPSIPKGTRDFGPIEVKRRQYITNIIREAFENFGFQPIETPVMENLNTLTGKYGDEGEQLLYRVLNQGQKLKKANKAALEEGNLPKFAASIAEKGLRYDLTIPFARYVVMNRGTLTFPFKRYQIQPVWRGDRPQKGRYREFCQCDVDVIGTTSLLSEVELIQIYDIAFKQFGFEVSIKLNNRKILAGIAETIGMSDKLTMLTIAIDKLDKVGIAGVETELVNRGVETEAIELLKKVLETTGSNSEKIDFLANYLKDSSIGMKGVEELKILFNYLSFIKLHNKIELDITLARGLNYYTGTILEVKTKAVKMGSLGGGGRYDDLTGTFGLKNMSGVGISFGLDRIYDVLNELDLFKKIEMNNTKVLFINFGDELEMAAFKTLQHFRKEGIAAEIYPESAKMKKQMKYAHAKNIPFVIFIGEEELKNKTMKVKNMTTGKQMLGNLSTVANLLWHMSYNNK